MNLVTSKIGCPMNINVENQSDGICQIAIQGKIRATGDATQTDELLHALGEGTFAQKILLSLQQTEYIDSSGIGWLLAADKRIRQSGGRLIVHSIPKDVKHVLTLMNLDRVLTLANDRKHAHLLIAGEAVGGEAVEGGASHE
jgi:anti-anti-sigma factor